MIPTVETSLAGWSRYPTLQSHACRPEKQVRLRDLVAEAGAQRTSVLARGAGRSYGDAALNGRGTTVLMERLDRMLAFDEDTGTLQCEAGVTLGEILKAFVPRGWFLPVTPGTKHVTVGGAVAFDVHGKNHHCDGGFSNFVERFDLLTASGETLTCSREENADLFRATVSGAGLTGIITDVTFRLRPISSAYINVRTVKSADLDETFALFDRLEPQYPYSVAWIDCLARGRALGRCHLMLGDHATPGDLNVQKQSDPLHYDPTTRLAVPFDMPGALLNPLSVRAFNTLYYARQRQKETHGVADFDAFFYPLDFIGQWNRMYGKRGFVQYQCVFPMEASRSGLVKLLTKLSEAGAASFLAVLKRLGAEDAGLLSFPMRGYTLSLDIPMRRGLGTFLDELDRLVLDHGGRVYLAKDAYLSSASFRAMYPHFPEWLAIKSRVDPDNLFTSALSERLNIRSEA